MGKDACTTIKLWRKNRKNGRPKTKNGKADIQEVSINDPDEKIIQTDSTTIEMY